MPGTQPQQVSLENPDRCLNCHAGYNSQVEPGFNWKGSMMAQSSRDFLFWACMVVAGQDSIWAVGRPNAVDICERCHFPKGWLEGRSDPPNASLMTDGDYDGVQCDFCHRLYDPFFEATYNGTREGNDWMNYWDETNASDTPSQSSANQTHTEDRILSQSITLFNGNPFYSGDYPFSPNYKENASGQYFVTGGNQKRASFADADARHKMYYNRYHKSKYFCASCHDVSNPVLANLEFKETLPGDGVTVLPTEESSAYSYFHVERTFSEFMLSDYGLQGGAPGIGPFSPQSFETSYPDNFIAKCQDCHMKDVVGRGCDKNGVPIRPTESIEHPNSGQPLHDLTGGNAWVSYVLASASPGASNYDAVNASLLNQGANMLTLDMAQGEGIDPDALLAGVDRALHQLYLAASIQNLEYDTASGSLTFRIQNQTGHKLISGFPEGRRMFVNIRAYDTHGNLIREINPYDEVVSTLKGLDPSYSPNSPSLAANELYVDELVYEMHPSSDLTGEDKTFHFALATSRYKDNRIPPKGFRINEAEARLSEPVWEGNSLPGLFNPQEYAGGYDDVALSIESGAVYVEVGLFYQTTSREYMEFLRDEIKGTGNLTLSSPTPSGEAEAYIIQSDPFFGKLKAWGETIWELWLHNKNVPGAAPVLMAHSTTGTPPSVQGNDIIGTWTGQGVYYLDSSTNSWIKLASFANLIASGDLDGDSLADLIGVWTDGLWVRYSSSGNWAKLSSPPLPNAIACGDINGDGRDDIIGSWSSGTFFRNTIGQNWVYVSSQADSITAGDLDGDGTDDLIGVWENGLWVKYSNSGAWTRLSKPLPTDIASGDLNGDGRDDVLGTWSSGTFYMDTLGSSWVYVSTPANLVAAGDLDGDGTDDLIGTWGGTNLGLWVKYSSTMRWKKIVRDPPIDLDSGVYRGGSGNGTDR
jgi:hypothetical protein